MENSEKKEIKKLTGNGEIVANGFYRNMGQFGVSYLLFADNEVFSLSGFAAKQFDDIADDLFGTIFKLKYETKRSKKYGKNYVVIKSVVIKSVKLVDDGSKLKVERDDE